LVRFYEGVDGLKTGFTTKAGYCLTASAKKNDMRLISVVMGVDTTENRSSDTVKMLNYGFNTFKINIIKNKEEVLGKVRVEGGNKDYVNVRLIKDATEILKMNEEENEYTFNILVDKLKAPLKIGDKVGTVEIIDNEGHIIDEVEITVDENVKKASLFDYLVRNFKIVSGGKVLIKQ